MPIEFDKTKNSIKKHQRTRNGTLTKDLPPQKAPAPPESVEKMRVRILRTIRGSRHGTFIAGQSAELPVDLARSWIGSGLAEQDKSLDGPPETK